MAEHFDDRQRQDEAKRILTRVREETAPQTGIAAERMSQGVLRHFAAGDADQADRIEVWGTRIGRMAGVVGFLVFAAILASQLLAA